MKPGLLTLTTWVPAALAMAQPSCTTAACVFDHADTPTATPTITTYPTTLVWSSTWSMVRTTNDDGLPGTTTEYQTAVTTEAHAAAPTSFPATVLQQVTTTHVYIFEASSTTTLEPTSSQWIVHQPGPSDLPRFSLGANSSINTIEAQQCADAGQQTGCLRQCTQRDGLWYCFDKHAWYEENVMGRACWWTQPDDNDGSTLVLRYLMLAEPCRAGDAHIDCEACRLYG